MLVIRYNRLWTLNLTHPVCAETLIKKSARADQLDLCV